MIFFGLNYAYHDQNISINTLNWAKSVPLIVEIGQIQPNLRSNLIGCDQKGRIRTNSSELIKKQFKNQVIFWHSIRGQPDKICN